MSSVACKDNVPIPNIPVSDEEEDIGLTPLTRPGTPLIIGPKSRSRPHEILVPSPTSKDDFPAQWSLSSSSSDLLDKNIFTPRTLPRSGTLPEPLVTTAAIKFEDTMVEDLVFEPQKLICLRRWILTVVVGVLTVKRSKLGA